MSMALPSRGSLADTPFTELFASLAMAKATGKLEVTRGKVKRALTLDGGRVVAMTSNALSDSFGRLLESAKKVDSATAQRIRRAAHAAGISQEEWVLQEGLMGQAEVNKYLRLQAQVRLTSLMGWRDGSFRFLPLDRVKGDGHLDGLAVPRIILKALRRQADSPGLRMAVIRRTSDTPALAANPPYPLEKMGLTADELAVAQSFDGASSVGQILMTPGLDPSDVMTLVYGLYVAGLVYVGEEAPSPGSRAGRRSGGAGRKQRASAKTAVVAPPPSSAVAVPPPPSSAVAVPPPSAAAVVVPPPSAAVAVAVPPPAVAVAPPPSVAVPPPPSRSVSAPAPPSVAVPPPRRAAVAPAPVSEPSPAVVASPRAQSTQPAPATDAAKPIPPAAAPPAPGVAAAPPPVAIVGSEVTGEATMGGSSLNFIDEMIAEEVGEFTGEVPVAAASSADNPLVNFSMAGFSEADINLAERFKADLERMRDQNHFELLGVDRQVGSGEIRKAYFKLVNDYHPDKLVGKPEAIQNLGTEIFNTIQGVYDTLTDADKREAYVAKVFYGREMEEEEAAVATVEMVLKADAFYKKGIGVLNAGDVRSAHRAFEQAVDIYPQEPEYRACLGYTTFALNYPKNKEIWMGGEAMIQEALRENAKLDRGNYFMGLLNQTKGKTTLARKYFVRAVKANPKNIDAMKAYQRIKNMPKEEEKGMISSLFSVFKK